MVIRPLTAEEAAASAAAKNEANKHIGADRAELMKQIRTLAKKRLLTEAARLQNQRERLKLVTGTPVYVQTERESIIVNYEALSAFNRKISARNWRRSARVDIVNRNPVLAIQYEAYGSRDRGWAEFYQLPQYQVDLMEKLPIIPIADY